MKDSDLVWSGSTLLSFCTITVVVSTEAFSVSIVIFPWITKPRAAEVNEMFPFYNQTFISLHVEIFEIWKFSRNTLAVEEHVRYAWAYVVVAKPKS